MVIHQANQKLQERLKQTQAKLEATEQESEKALGSLRGEVATIEQGYQTQIAQLQLQLQQQAQKHALEM